MNTNSVIREEHHYQAIDNQHQHQSHHQPAPPYMKIQEPVEMNGSGSDMDIEDDGQVSNGNDDSAENDESEGEEGNLMIEDEPMAKKSIYMTEKTSKKKMLKDGKVSLNLMSPARHVC
jgi:hypothetical protein